jgi:phosphatidylserine decarboxylase
MFKIHREGYSTIRQVLALFVILNVLSSIFIGFLNIYFSIIFVVSILLSLFIVRFFRYPTRQLVHNENQLISPANGKIVVIEETYVEEYFNDNRLQVSIYMSGNDIHLNRVPITGIVKYYRYYPGPHYPAWHPKSSDKNEHNTTIIHSDNGQEIMIRQIAGILARRIKFYPEPGKRIFQGDELGFIKFGSRVDIFLPPGTKINVELHQKVKSSLSVIAEFK